VSTNKTNKLIPLFDTLAHRESASIPSDYLYQDDITHAGAFIFSYRGSSATFNAYRREIERLLQWCEHIAKKPLGELKKQDIENYIYFCQRPYPEWIATQKCDRFLSKEGRRIPNSAWRPFVATVSKVQFSEGKRAVVKNFSLSQSAVKAIFAILSSFFNYLIQEDYVLANPVQQMRQKSKFIRKHQSQTAIRRLSELQWCYVIETAEKMAEVDPAHERTLFMMNALFGMYLRISELASSERWQPTMGDFFRDQDGSWWFKTVGKGNKERNITVSNAMLEALKRYRQALDMPSLPSPGETTLLLYRNRGNGPLSSTRQIRLIVQNCFDKAIERMRQDGMEEDVNELRAATVHWLRHTGISEDVKHRPREHVRDDAGHGSSAITDLYIDIELRARHASGRKKQIKPD
jgi:site-specific recombinase XerD